MRKLAQVLTILAALSFVGGLCRAYLSALQPVLELVGMTPQGYWRGTVALLLFAIVVLMLDRPQKS